MITSLFMPARLGRSTIFWGSLPVRMAAVPRVSADAAPQVTMAASQWSSVAIRWPTLSCSSSSITKCLEAYWMASITSGGISEAVMAVYVPAALMKGRTPRSRK